MERMDIEAVPTTDRWNVLAFWHGQPRVVFSGGLFECIAWRAANGGC